MANTETLVWANATPAGGAQLADFNGVAHNVGDITVTATLLPGEAIDTNADLAFNGLGVDAGELYTGGNYTGGGVSNSALHLSDADDSTAGYSHTVTLALDFTSNTGGDNGVDNLDFWISDIDQGSWDDVITIRVYDLNGDLITDPGAVTFPTLGSNLVETGDTLTVGTFGNLDPVDAGGAVNVVVTVPISRIEIDYGNDDDGGQRVEISDLTYEPHFPPPCFTTGTRILTENGEVAVEDLVEGDLVVTKGNGLMPIRWIGQRTIKAVGSMAPVCISKGTLGNSRDLLVSPGHHMLLADARISALFAEDEVLVTAKSLLDGDRIYRKSGGEVTYFHILFDQHEIIFAEGAPAESLLLEESTLRSFSKETSDEVLALFPELNGKASNYGKVARPVLNPAEAGLLVN